MARPVALTEGEAQQRAIELYELGNIRQTTNHFPGRMKECGALEWDLANVIFHGLVVEKRWYRKLQKEWRYRIIGDDLDGNHLAIIFSIDEKIPEIVMITCGRW